MNRLTCGLLFLALLTPLAATATETAEATFVVHCYDVGAGALEHRPGVVAVERGWHGFREVDRVRYDPQTVRREQLEEWLREAGTYVQTIDGQGNRP